MYGEPKAGKKAYADGNKRGRKAREDLQEVEKEKKTTDAKLERSQKEVAHYKNEVIKLQDARRKLQRRRRVHYKRASKSKR